MRSHAGGIKNGSLGQGAEDELALRYIWVPLSAKSQGGGTPAMAGYRHTNDDIGKT